MQHLFNSNFGTCCIRTQRSESVGCHTCAWTKLPQLRAATDLQGHASEGKRLCSARAILASCTLWLGTTFTRLHASQLHCSWKLGHTHDHCQQAYGSLRHGCAPRALRALAACGAARLQLRFFWNPCLAESVPSIRRPDLPCRLAMSTVVSKGLQKCIFISGGRSVR